MEMKDNLAVIHSVKSYGGSVMSLLDLIDMLSPYYSLKIFMSKKADRRSIEAVESKVSKDSIIFYSKEPFIFANYSGIIPYKTLGFWKGILQCKNNEYWKELLLKTCCKKILLNSSVLAPLGSYLNKNDFKTYCYDRETHNDCLGGLFDRISRHFLNKQTAVFFLSHNELEHYNLNTYSVVAADVLNRKFEVFSDEKETSLSKLSLPQSNYYVLFVGGISKLKGTLQILKAMELINIEDDSIKLLLVGDFDAEKDISYTKECREIIYSNKNYIYCYGIRNDIEQFYNACDVLVFPSTKSHQARPVYEAGWFKKPVIISDFNETKEYAIDKYNVLTFEPCNIRALADCIIDLRGDSEFAHSIGIRGYDLCVRKHSHLIVSKIIVDVIKGT